MPIFEYLASKKWSSFQSDKIMNSNQQNHEPSNFQNARYELSKGSAKWSFPSDYHELSTFRFIQRLKLGFD